MSTDESRKPGEKTICVIATNPASRIASEASPVVTNLHEFSRDLTHVLAEPRHFRIGDQV